MQEYAAKRNGLCLTKIYTNSITPVEWQCVLGHRWFAQWGTVKSVNSWCKKCAGLAPYTIDDAKEYAKNHGGVCLSERNVNGRRIFHWQCDKGHEWSSALKDMKSRNYWCRKCAAKKRAEKSKLTIGMMQKLAEEKDGICLSLDYIDNKTYLVWRCNMGHEWDAPPSSIISGRWCRKCSYIKRGIDRRRKQVKNHIK